MTREQIIELETEVCKAMGASAVFRQGVTFYRVGEVTQRDVWSIHYQGEQISPYYSTEREAWEAWTGSFAWARKPEKTLELLDIVYATWGWYQIRRGQGVEFFCETRGLGAAGETLGEAVCRAYLAGLAWDREYPTDGD